MAFFKRYIKYGVSDGAATEPVWTRNPVRYAVSLLTSEALQHLNFGFYNGQMQASLACLALHLILDIAR